MRGGWGSNGLCQWVDADMGRDSQLKALQTRSTSYLDVC